MSTENLLRLLAASRPDASQGDLLRLLDEIPDAKAPRKPDRARQGSRARTDASMTRRRSWCASGRLPPALAARFTCGEVAALAVIAVEVAKHGACRLAIDHVAALAGVGRSTVKRALHAAQDLSLIRVEERRLTAWRNDTNVVTILDASWLAWLRLSRKGGVQFGTGANTNRKKEGFRREKAAQAQGSTQESSKAQAVPWPDAAHSRGIQDRPSMAGVYPAKAELPGLRRRGVHGHAGLRDL